MTAKNHFLFSISVVSLTLGTLDPYVLLLAGGMSLLPDIDSSKSVVGKIFFPLSRLIERHFPHRTFTHSFFMTAILAIGAIPLAFEGTEFYFAALIGFFCGWFLDVFTKAGVSAFYPMSMARLVIPANPALRLSTGSKNEWLFSVIFLALFVISFQLHSSGGIMQIFTSLLAQPTGVAELYLAHSNKNRIYVNLSGQTSAGLISGRYEVVSLLSNNTFLIRRDNSLLLVGDSQRLHCHVRSDSAKGEIGEAIYVSTQEVRLNDQPVSKFIEHFSGREILISGELILPNEEITVPNSQMQFNAITVTTNLDSKQARLQNARLEDLQPLLKIHGNRKLDRQDDNTMKLWLLIVALSISTACKTAEIPKSAETFQSEKPLTIGDNKTFSGESLPSEIKVRVTISRPEDLRVSVGEKIKTGDVIADRSRERNALLQKKQQATLALDRMKKLMFLKDENLEKPVLPDASFAEYEAAINRAQVAVEAAKHSISLQKSRIEQIEKLPFPVDLTKVKQHESARLELLKSELLAAESNLNLERAKLETAKANSNYAEQKDALEIQKSKITAHEQRITIEAQITQTEAQITNLNVQIVALSAVRTPFAGTIKKINWEGQTNAEINVVITVDIDSGGESERAK